jgi:cyclohexa-1,5-dienecarbonyl-CoA hydratase
VVLDPDAAALAYFDAHLRPKSAASLALALTAARAPMISHVKKRLADVEALYLERLMHTHDANEGLAAFLEKREPAWENR